MADRTEHRIHSEECNRVDWRSTLRYAATAKRSWERDIVRLLMLRKWVGTAFGTARLIEFALSADDALLFRSVGPLHHRRHAKAIRPVANFRCGADLPHAPAIALSDKAAQSDENVSRETIWYD
jgi:hypothetical protein